MDLSEIDRIIARLSADEGLRERFISDPLAVGREEGLSAAESRRLKRAAAARLDTFAATARDRRVFEMAKLLPLTQRTLKGRFKAHLNRYVSTHEPGGIERLFGDALDFADYLDARLRAEHIGSGWTLDLLRYEKARLKAADPKRRFVVALFRHDISRLVRSVARKEENPSVVRRPTAAFWWRTQRHAPVRYAVVSTPGLFGRKN
jgi:hypothetical protein